MALTPASPSEAIGPAEAAARLASHTVLDARDAAAFARGHLAGAGRMSTEEFTPLRAELPPRTARVLVVHDRPADAKRAADALAALGYPHVCWLDAPLGELPGGHADTGPSALLWRPSPFLERVWPQLPRGRALDLAAGSGRESVFLAARGWEAHAWDHAPDALERAETLAARHGVTIHTRVVELERGPLPEPDGGWNVVMAFRYLHRPLFPWIARAVAPGGVVVYETFHEAQARFGRPKQPRFLLRDGELREAFPGFVIEHEEVVAPDEPPVMARLLARRPD
ncbi:MAG: methyltransferase domain-containing protein [Candidatus Eisenbacteria bacterium]